MIKTTTEKLNSTGGLAIVGQILEKIGFCGRSAIDSPSHTHVRNLSSVYTFKAEQGLKK